MPLSTYQPTANTSPDPGQGGSAVTTPSNTGHASTVSSVTAPSVQTKTCIWSAFPAGGGQVQSVTLKLDHTSSGALGNVAHTNSFSVDYSLNNGSSWTNAVNRQTFTASQGPTTFSVALPVSQDLTQVKVRDSIGADASGGGVGTTSATATISNIKIEVVTVADVGLLVMM